MFVASVEVSRHGDTGVGSHRKNSSEGTFSLLGTKRGCHFELSTPIFSHKIKDYILNPTVVCSDLLCRIAEVGPNTTK
jgi:hypothetical protein